MTFLEYLIFNHAPSLTDDDRVGLPKRLGITLAISLLVVPVITIIAIFVLSALSAVKLYDGWTPFVLTTQAYFTFIIATVFYVGSWILGAIGRGVIGFILDAVVSEVHNHRERKALREHLKDTASKK